MKDCESQLNVMWDDLRAAVCVLHGLLRNDLF